jgi:hypothetical protein
MWNPIAMFTVFKSQSNKLDNQIKQL